MADTKFDLLKQAGIRYPDLIDLRTCIQSRITALEKSQHPYDYWQAEIDRLNRLSERISLAALME